VGKFLQEHGALVILTWFVFLGMAAVFYLGVRTHVEPKEVFAFFAGFTTGSFSALTFAMRQGSGQSPERPEKGAGT